MAILTISSSDFTAEVLKAAEPVLVSFEANCNNTCQILATNLEALAAGHREIKVCRLKVVDAPDLVERYQIMSVPSLLFFYNGELRHRAIGAQTPEALTALLDKIL